MNVTPKIPPNPEVMRIAAEYESKLNGSLERAVGFFESPVDAQKRTLRVREMPLGDFMADGLRWRFKTDVGLVNGGSLRGDRIFPAGEVSEKNLTEILPFGNGIEVVDVGGRGEDGVLVDAYAYAFGHFNEHGLLAYFLDFAVYAAVDRKSVV